MGEVPHSIPIVDCRGECRDDEQLRWFAATPPLRLLRIDEDKNTEGAVVLTFLEQMWMSGISSCVARPRWIDAWHHGAIERCELIPYPEDLQRRAEAEVEEIER